MVFGPGWQQVEASEKRWYMVGLVCLVILGVVALAGCADQPVAVDPVVVEIPVPVPCEAPAVTEPVWALDTVQLSGDRKADLVLIWRAAEAELEQRRAYVLVLKAAVEACR